MSKTSAVSRRRAAGLIAGSLAATASVGLTKLDYDETALASKFVKKSVTEPNVQIEVAAMLTAVRLAPERSTRTMALRRLGDALLALDNAEATVHRGESTGPNQLTLYRQRDPSGILAMVIARELEDWPRSDARWLGRFSDLQSAVRTRFGAADA